MTSFDRREEAFEAKFAHDEEHAFKARARGLRMLGLWAADKRGEAGAIAEDYARSLIDADISPVPNAAFNKLVFDLAAYGIDATQIRQKRDEFLARTQRSTG
jgi:hypothetical protein